MLAAFIAVTTALWVRVKISYSITDKKKWPAQASKRYLKVFFNIRELKK